MRRRLDYLAIALGCFGVASLAAWILLGCSSSGVTGPSETSPEQTTSRWHGARVTGHPAAELRALLDRAGPAVAAGWPGWTPARWTIEGWQGRVPCSDALNGRADGCRGTTETRARRIRVSWINGAADVVQIAAWELCNAARWDQTGELRDVGYR
jgi:hypothetical protein